jgi:hypothetical protein
MKIQQLSVFVENNMGQLRAPIALLAREGINIRTLSLADTEKYGILRLIVDDPARGRKALEGAGCVVKTTEVLALEVPDRPGGMDEVLAAVESAALNIEYLYAFPFGREGRAALIFRFDDPDAAIEKLGRMGVNLATGLDG